MTRWKENKSENDSDSLRNSFVIDMNSVVPAPLMNNVIVNHDQGLWCHSSAAYAYTCIYMHIDYCTVQPRVQS